MIASVAEIAAWLLPAFERVDLDDMVTASRHGATDDAPHLSLTERTYTAAQERAYGEWGCERSVNWEIGKPGEPFSAGLAARRAAEFVASFVRRNGRVKLVLRGTLLNRLPRSEMVVDQVAA